MSDDAQALQRLMDAYADGRLDPAELPALVEHLRHSEAARDHLAAVAVAERLLRAAGQGGVPVARIMAHVAEAEARWEDGEPPPRGLRGPRITVSRSAGVGPHARAAVSARDRRAPQRRLSPWLFLGVLLVAAVMAGIWYQRRQAVRTAQGLPVEQRAPREAAPARRPSLLPSRETQPAVAVAQPATARVARVMADAPPEQRTVHAVSPSPPADGVPSPPMGDGSDEPGFVPPPRIETVAPPPPRAVSPDETDIPGGRTPPMAHTEARTPPQPPVIVTKIKEK